MRISLPPHIAWPAFVISILLMGMVTTLYTVYLANQSPPQVVENYYEKALNWDSEQAVAAASQALGWDLQLAIAPPQTEASERIIQVTLLDAAGQPITNLEGSVRARRPDQIGILAETPLMARPDGSYEGHLPLTKRGLWDLEVIVQREDERFVQTVRREIYQ